MTDVSVSEKVVSAGLYRVVIGDWLCFLAHVLEMFGSVCHWFLAGSRMPLCGYTEWSFNRFICLLKDTGVVFRLGLLLSCCKEPYLVFCVSVSFYFFRVNTAGLLGPRFYVYGEFKRSAKSFSRVVPSGECSAQQGGGCCTLCSPALCVPLLIFMSCAVVTLGLNVFYGWWC